MVPTCAMTLMLSEVHLSGDGLIHGLLFLLVVGIVLGIVWFLIQRAPFLNELFKQVLGYIIIFIGALIIINFLLGIVGHPLVTW
jgi:hypothetical protein